jgi:phenylalanyl-tRNA synthetase beta chain
MKVSLNWLLDFLPELAAQSNDKTRVEKIAEALTSVGFEIETMTPVAQGLTGLKVAEVKAIAPHPKADKLRIVTVIADGEPTDVVCGASNVPDPGGRVLWATPGSTLPGGIQIETRPVRGVSSPGMLVSEGELGLGEGSEGIIVLGPFDKASPGSDPVPFFGLSDWVLEVNVTPNRGDALSHLGLARELAAALRTPFARPENPVVSCTDESPTRSVRIEDSEGCARYQGRMVLGMRLGPSPLQMRTRLAACGVRAISNLVDVTNYVLLEMGHPLHAFDNARIVGPVVVRRARAGETLTTLDGSARELLAGDIIIADNSGPIALAGIMGGAGTQVGSATVDVFLECATFDPVSIRRTAKRLSMHSESSHRFERGVDADGIPAAAARAASLLAYYGRGLATDTVIEATARSTPQRVVSLPIEHLRVVTGLRDASETEITETLSRLFGANNVAIEANALKINVPSYRPDLLIGEDIIEEYLRLTGFSAVTPTPVSHNASSIQSPELPADKARDRLCSSGFSEIVTYGFVSRRALTAVGGEAELARAVVVQNPLSAEHEVMRTTLLAGLVEAAARNLSRGVSSPNLFEVGPVVERRTDGSRVEKDPVWSPANERTVAAAILCGNRADWLRPGEAVDFYDAKRAAIDLLSAFAPAETFVFRANGVPGYLHPGIGATISAGDTVVGAVGEVHPGVRKAFGLDARAFFLEVDLDRLKTVPNAIRAIAPPRLPAATRDVSFFIDTATTAGEQAEAFASAKEPLLVFLQILEDFRDSARVPAGKKGMLWTLTYRSDERTLTDAEVDAAHARVLAGLTGRLTVEVR